MSDIKRNLITRMLDIAELTQIVGGDPAKIFPGTVPPKISGTDNVVVDVDRPYMVVIGDGGDPIGAMDATGDSEVSFTVEVYGKTWTQVGQMHRAVANPDNGMHNNGSVWFGNLWVQSCMVSEAADAQATPISGEDSTSPYATFSIDITCSPYMTP